MAAPECRVFFNDTATTEIYTLSLHDALPISQIAGEERHLVGPAEQNALRVGDQLHSSLDLFPLDAPGGVLDVHVVRRQRRSEEHTSELQSRQYLVCRLLLVKKNVFALSLTLR